MSLRLRLTFAATLLLALISLLGVLLVHSVGSSELHQVDQQLKSALPIARTIGAPLPASFHPIGSLPQKFNTDKISAYYIAAITNGHRNVISRPLDAVDATMSFFRLAFLLGGMILLAVVAATGFWIDRLGLRPIAEVTEVADAITAGDRTRRVSIVRNGTEVGKLAQAFNVMLDEQLSLEAQLRQFVADASHELRTPVSVILGITELWRQGELRNGEERDEAIHRIGVSGNQMGRLVDELLLLARLDEGRPMDRAPVDLARLIEEVVDDASTTDPHRTIGVKGPGSVVVQGDPSGLRRVVANLVNNALRYTPSNAAVQVRLSVNGATVMLEVEDSGPGMNDEEASHAFDRFWRADASRSRSGTGLGLPIVRSVVVAHAGDVTLESDSVTGTRVTVILPCGEESCESNVVAVRSVD